jgi:hypothetical protein
MYYPEAAQENTGKFTKKLSKFIETTQETTNSLGSDTIFMRISLSGGNPVKYTDPDGLELDITGSEEDVKIFLEYLHNKTGYKISVDENGKASIDGRRERDIGNSKLARAVKESINMKEKIELTIVNEAKDVLIDSFMDTGKANVDIGDIKSMDSATSDTRLATAILMHVFSEQIYSVKKSSDFIKAHAYATRKEASILGAYDKDTREILRDYTPGGTWHLPYFNRKGKLITSFDFSFNNNYTPGR